MAMKDVERLFVDTNVLVYATNELSAWYLPATAALQTARQLGTELIISTQILREYLAAALDPAAIGVNSLCQKS